MRSKLILFVLLVLFGGSAMIGALPGNIPLVSNIQKAVDNIAPNVFAENPTVPNGIECYYPITLSNSQSSPVLDGTQVMIGMDWNSLPACSSYLGTNAKNVLWFDSNGNNLTAWVENGTTSSTNSIVWVKLDQEVPADGALTIYIGFYSTSTNNLLGTNWGWYPTYTDTYGQYDNGQNVFVVYSDFAGDSCPSGWTCSGSTTIDNGATITNSGYVMTSSNYGDNSSEIGDLDADMPAPTSSDNAIIGFANDCSAVGGSCNVVGFDINTGFSDTNAVGAWSVSGSGYNHETSVQGTGSNIWSLYFPAYSSEVTVGYQMNYGTMATIGPETAGPDSALAFGGANTQGSQAAPVITWARIRVYPPDGVMPTVSQDKVQIEWQVSPYTSVNWQNIFTIDSTNENQNYTALFSPTASITMQANTLPCASSAPLSDECTLIWDSWNIGGGQSQTITAGNSSLIITETAIVNDTYTQLGQYGNLWNFTYSNTGSSIYAPTCCSSGGFTEAFSFIASYNGNITLRLPYNSTGDFDGQGYTVALQTDSSGEPSGTILSSTYVNFTETSTFKGVSGGFYELNPFNSEVSLTKGTEYWIVISYHNGTSTGNPIAIGIIQNQIDGCQFSSFQNNYNCGLTVDNSTNGGSTWQGATLGGKDLAPAFALDYNSSTWAQGQTVSGLGAGAYGGRTIGYEPLISTAGAGSGTVFPDLFGNLNVTAFGTYLESNGTTSDSQMNLLLYSGCSGGLGAISCTTLVENETFLTASQVESIPSNHFAFYNISLGSTVSITNGTTWFWFLRLNNASSDGLMVSMTIANHNSDPSQWSGEGAYRNTCLGGTNCEDPDASPMAFEMKLANTQPAVGSVSFSLSISCANSCPTSGTFALSGGSVSPSSASWGTSHDYSATSSATITIMSPANNFVFSNDGTTDTFTASNTTFSFTLYDELSNTYKVQANAQTDFDTGMSWTVTGTIAGSGSQTICTISSSAAISDSCTGSSDYDQSTTIPQAASSPPSSSRWQSTSACVNTPTSGSNTYTCQSYKQWDNNFKFNSVGSGSSTLSCNQYGSAATLSLTSSYQGFYCDNEASATATNPVTISSTEQYTDNGTSFTITSGGNDNEFTYSHEYKLTTTTSGEGSISPSTEFVVSGDGITISASGSNFVNITGSGSGSCSTDSTSCLATVNGALTEVAYFSTPATWLLFSIDITCTNSCSTSGTFSLSGSGLTPTSAGWGTTKDFNVSIGATVAITVPSDTSTVRYRFNDTSTTYSFAASNATFNFIVTQNVYLTVSPQTGGSANTASQWKDYESTLTITATPSTSYQFHNFTGSGMGSYSGTSNPSGTITMDAPITETIYFVKGNATITLTLTLSDSDQVLSGDNYIQLSYINYVGSVVTFNATNGVNTSFNASIGSTVSFLGPSLSSNSTLRWCVTNCTPSFAASSTMSVSYDYYVQNAVIISWTKPNTNPFATQIPTWSYTTFGQSTTSDFYSTPSTFWLDNNTSYTIENPFYFDLQKYSPTPAGGTVTFDPTILVTWSLVSPPVSSDPAVNGYNGYILLAFFGSYTTLLTVEIFLGILVLSISAMLYLRTRNPWIPLTIYIMASAIFIGTATNGSVTSLLPSQLNVVGYTFLALAIAGTIYRAFTSRP